MMIAIPVFFAVLAVVSAALAMIFSDSRRVILSAWVSGMSVGALFLSYGAEYLAVIQWVVGTLIAISFLVFATMYGEYGSLDARTPRERLFDAIPSVLAGAAFFAMIALAVHDFSESTSAEGPTGPNDLVAVGIALGQRHWVALELLGFMLVAVLIGAGVISRPEESQR